MTYATQAQNPQFKDNVILRINGGIYMGKRLPDSGMDAADFKGVMVQSGGFAVNPQVIDLEDAKASFGTNSYRLADIDQDVTKMLRDNQTSFLNQRVETWIGFSDCQMDFADYFQLPDTKVSRINFQNELWVIGSADASARLAKKPIFNLKATLAVDIPEGGLTAQVQEPIAAFPAVGRLMIEDELFDYTAKDDAAQTFTLALPSVREHSIGDQASNVFKIAAENPIDILLRFLQSTGAGTYADYPDGFGLEDAELDVAALESIRDEFFADEEFSFEIYDITNGLDWLADNILKPCALRFVTSITSKLSVVVLDQSLFGAAGRIIEPDALERGSVTWEIDDSTVRNTVIFKYGYDWETGKFAKTHQQTDPNSVTAYDAREPFIIEAKGVLADDRGDLIAEDRVTRWLSRLATATPKITGTAFMKHALALVGERVLLIYDLPTEIGDRNFRKELEVVKKGLIVEAGRVELELSFTNYSGLHEAFISPSDLIVAVASQKKITVTAGRGSMYQVGYVMRLKEEATGELTADQPRTIVDITGDVITFDANFDVTPLSGAYRVQFADYDEIMVDEKRYCSLSAGAADFPDGIPPYQITF